MTTQSTIPAMLKPPEYFQRVADNSRRRWDQLEADPELAGPWRQLFAQVQSPRHVVSELLQNADDAGATFASARIENETFVFEHNGEDFDESAFGSLCRFGYSNKRTLHTIGFRGIGFKSTFSLGESVFVATPSLTFKFDRGRFTQPLWVSHEGSTDLTRVTVRIGTPERKKELEKNLAEWKRSGASLLFFRNIHTLEVGTERVSRRSLMPGPVEGSEWIELAGAQSINVLLLKSEECAFPEEAIAEIKLERNLGEDFTIPPCRVEVVLGLPGDQRLFVVLPTGVYPPLPFSCNAPFIQDPARFVIKDPSTSATNRWLLGRVGRLAAGAMKAWLNNDSLSIVDSTAAYALLPNPPEESRTLNGECAQKVAECFEELLENECVLITTENTLCDKAGCIAPPPIVYDVWSPAQVKEWLLQPEADVLAREVDHRARQKLVAWEWLEQMAERDVLDKLGNGEPPPLPDSQQQTLRLWSWAQSQHPHDYGALNRRRLKIVPSVSSTILHSANDLVRLPNTSDALSKEQLDFLASLVAGIEREWLKFLSEARSRAGSTGVPPSVDAALQLLSDIGLSTASPSDKLIANAAATLVSRKPTIAEMVRLTHIAAAIDANVGLGFRYVSRSRKLQQASFGMVLDVKGEVESLVPVDWADEHLLHEEYLVESQQTRSRWNEWARSSKSELREFAELRPKVSRKWRTELEAMLASFSMPRPVSYPYVNGNFSIHDYDFDDTLLASWTIKAQSDATLWARVFSLIASASPQFWSSKMQASVEQHGNTYSKNVNTGPIPAAWIVRFRGVKCLPDNYGNPREPAELLMRTPETEPLLGVESFVLSDLDQPHLKKLLTAIGVRSNPTDFEKLLGRIRDLSTVEEVPVSEVVRWLGALDRLVARSDAARVREIREVFATEALVLTADDEWAQLGEVFRCGGEEVIPGIAILHPAVADLPLWTALGISNEPDDDLIVEWVAELPGGKVFEAGERSRIRAFLSRCPLRIWNETGHWLALDGTWTKSGQFRFHLTRRADDRINALFPKFKAVVADLSMVPREIHHPAFSTTSELNTQIEYRLNDQSSLSPADGEVRPWLLSLGQSLTRISLKDAEQQARIRAAAQVLGRTVFSHKPELRVVPYVQQTPAGEKVAVRALWTGIFMLVADRSPAHYTEPLIDELSRVFLHPRVVDAIRVCIDRDSHYVEEYIAANFQLSELSGPPSESAHVVEGEVASNHIEIAPETELPPMPPSKVDSELDEPEAVTADPSMNDCTEESDEIVDPVPTSTPNSPAINSPIANLEASARHRHSYVNSRANSPPRLISDTRQTRSSPTAHESGGPTFVTEFAKLKQFVWNSDAGAYSRPDGHSLNPVEGPFQWEWRDKDQDVVRKLWFAEQRLDKGVEIDTQVWEAIKRSPHNTSIVVLWENGQPRSIPGETLSKMVNDKLLVIYPSTYRLKSST